MDQSAFIPGEEIASYKHKQKKLKKKSKIPWINDGSWSETEKFIYCKFIEENMKIMVSQKLRRSKKVFEMMSVKVKTRTSTQCRSHHQKLIEKLQTPQKIVDSLKLQLGFQKNPTIKIQLSQRDLKSKKFNNNIESTKNHKNTLCPQQYNEGLDCLFDFQDFEKTNKFSFVKSQTEIMNFQIFVEQKDLFDSLLSQNKQF